MRKVKMLLIALAALTVVGGATSSPASALFFKFRVVTSGTTTIESAGGGIAVKCTSEEGSGEGEGLVGDNIDLLFLGCTAGGFKCTGLTDTTTGSVLVKAKLQAYPVKVGGVLVALAVLLFEPVHIECLGVLTEIRGSVIGRVTNASGAKNLVQLTFVGSKGTNEFTSFKTESGEELKYHLESETGGGAFVETSLNGIIEFNSFTPEEETTY